MFVQTGQQRAVLNASMCWCSCTGVVCNAKKTAAGTNRVIDCICNISHKDRTLLWGSTSAPDWCCVGAAHTYTQWWQTYCKTYP